MRLTGGYCCAENLPEDYFPVQRSHEQLMLRYRVVYHLGQMREASY